MADYLMNISRCVCSQSCPSSGCDRKFRYIIAARERRRRLSFFFFRNEIRDVLHYFKDRKNKKLKLVNIAKPLGCGLYVIGGYSHIFRYFLFFCCLQLICLSGIGGRAGQHKGKVSDVFTTQNIYCKCDTLYSQDAL